MPNNNVETIPYANIYHSVKGKHRTSLCTIQSPIINYQFDLGIGIPANIPSNIPANLKIPTKMLAKLQQIKANKQANNNQANSNQANSNQANLS